jgi:ACR3 family arsenite transporter
MDSIDEKQAPKMELQPGSINAHASPCSPTAAAVGADVEKYDAGSTAPITKQSTFKSLGLLDRFLAVWIFLAMAVGIILGNFVPNTSPALQRGTFVGVSIPIGMLDPHLRDGNAWG